LGHSEANHGDDSEAGSKVPSTNPATGPKARQQVVSLQG
jgi:hypothetical protein